MADFFMQMTDNDGNRVFPYSHLNAVKDSNGNTAEDLLNGKQDPLSIVPVYEAVTDTTGKNPATEGWYELVSGEYVLTEDTTPASGKTYYEQKSYNELTW